MYIHPNEDNSWLTEGCFIGGLEEEPNQDKQIKIFLEYLSDADSPFALKKFVFEKDVFWDKYFGSTRDVVLDYVADNVSQWDPDEVACFFIDVITDCYHCNIFEYTYLKNINLPEMLFYEYAGEFLLSNFWEEDAYEDMVVELIEFYGWNEYFAKELEEKGMETGVENAKIYKMASTIMRNTASTLGNLLYEAKDFLQAMQFAKDEFFYKAIEKLIPFYESNPNILPSDVCKVIAECYVGLRWNGFALTWITLAETHDPADESIKAIRKRIVSEDNQQLEILSLELQKKIGMSSPDVLDALVLAEFLYRYHGKMLHEYSPIISGYSRAVEMFLKETLSPKLKNWIAKYGLENQNGRRYIEIGKNGKWHEDEKNERMTLGKWKLLFILREDKFEKDNALHFSKKKGNFYNLVHREFGATVFYDRIVDYGKHLSALSDARNKASHEVFRNWEMVKEIRKLAFDLLHSPSTTKGPLF